MKCGLVIFAVFSLTLIFGMMLPSSSSIAASLYTPPKTGFDLLVISRSPTPKVSTCAPCIIRSRIRYSSSEFDAVILQFGRPASSSILRAFLDKYEMSPESRRMAKLVMPRGSRISLNARIAFGTPDLSVL